MAADTYLPRLLDDRVERILSDLPALLITGPRATGKTTTARRHAKATVRLDSLSEGGVFSADPDAALKAISARPVLLDEWQAVPGVLGAVKRAVDEGAAPGSFILTGSVRADLDTETWPGTGRVVRLRMYGLTVAEIERSVSGITFLDVLAGADMDRFTLPSSVPNLVEYAELALRGGFPNAALQTSEESRQTWLEGYVDQLVTRDTRALDELRDPGRVRRYLEVLALNTSGMVENKTLYDAARIDRKTATTYDRLLTNLFVLDFLPPWFNNRLTRLVKSPRRFLIDPSLVGSILRVDRASLLRDANLLGRMLETFVLAQLRPELETRPLRPNLYHLREDNARREIDIIAEMAAGKIIALEVKATAAPSFGDAAHLTWLRDVLDDRFLAGAVLHTGPRPFRLGERIFALPICTMWGPRQ